MIDFEDEKRGYSAVIYVMESSKSVVIHFGGFDNVKEATSFSKFLMNDLGIESLVIPRGATLH